MTPLFQKVVKELTLPRRARSFVDPAGMLSMLEDVHCFEVSAVVDIANTLASKMNECGQLDGETTFLPAPRTWIEFVDDIGRVGVLLVERGGNADIVIAVNYGDVFESCDTRCSLQLHTSALAEVSSLPAPNWYTEAILDKDRFSGNVSAPIYALLALINTPRVINRKTHAPHRGLERALLRARGVQGKFPLNAWTEIKLEVRPPHDCSGEVPEEQHLTGARALHFCRAHLRIRMGRLELVSAHWRGDASLGIKRSRYSLVPPRGELRP
jgi:hypothetical protein